MEKTRSILWIDCTLKAPPASVHLKSELKPYIRFLEYHGYDVSLADNSVQGIALLRDITFHAVLLNYDVSTRTDDLLTYIRKEDAYIPIILLTQAGGQEMMAQASLYGVDDVLIMPTNPRQLLSSLTFLLEKHSLQEAYTPQAYVENFNKQSALDYSQAHTMVDHYHDNDWQAWIDTYIHFVQWDIKLDGLPNVD